MTKPRTPLRTFQALIVAAAIAVSIAAAIFSLSYIHSSAQSLSKQDALFSGQLMAQELDRLIEAISLKLQASGQQILDHDESQVQNPSLWRDLMLEPAVDSITVRTATSEEVPVFTRGSESWVAGIPESVLARHQRLGSDLVVDTVSAEHNRYLVVSRAIWSPDVPVPTIVMVTLSNALVARTGRHIHSPKTTAIVLVDRTGALLLENGLDHDLKELTWDTILSFEWSASAESVILQDYVVSRTQLSRYPYNVISLQSVDPYMQTYRASLGIWSILLVILLAVGIAGMLISNILETRRYRIEKESISVKEQSRTQSLLRNVQELATTALNPPAAIQSIAKLLSEFLNEPVMCLTSDNEGYENESTALTAAHNTSTVWPITFKQEDGNVSKHWLRLDFKPSENALNVVDTAISIGERELQRRAMEIELQESEARFRAFMDNTPTPVVIRGRTNKYLYANNAFHLMSTDSFFNKNQNELAIMNGMLSIDSRENSAQQTASHPPPLQIKMDGTTRYLDVSRFSFSGPYGRILDAAIGVDISDLVETEKQLQAALSERQLLLREVNHRVKNNLAVIDGLLAIEQSRIVSDDGRAALVHVQNSVKSIALIHSSLHGSRDTGMVDFQTYCNELVSQISTSLRADRPGANVSVHVAPVRYPMKTVKSLGLIINELFTNAVKYGRGTDGTLIIEVELRDEGVQHVLMVRDHGNGFDSDLSATDDGSGTGLAMIRMLAQELEASVTATNDGGAIVELRFTNAGAADEK